MDVKIGTTNCPNLAPFSLSFRATSDHTKLLSASIQHVARVALDFSLQVCSWDRKDDSVKPEARRQVAVLKLKAGQHQGEGLGKEVPAGSPSVLHVVLLPGAVGQMLEEAGVETGRIQAEISSTQGNTSLEGGAASPT